MKAGQQEAIIQFALGKDVFVALLCYYSLPMVFDHLRKVEKWFMGMLVTVRLFMSLMKDQMSSLSSLGIAACFVYANYGC